MSSELQQRGWRRMLLPDAAQRDARSWTRPQLDPRINRSGFRPAQALRSQLRRLCAAMSTYLTFSISESTQPSHADYSRLNTTPAHLFGADDPFYGLSFNPVDDRTKPTNSAEGTNQLITYTGEIPDFVDIEAGLDSEQVACASPAAVEGAPSVLNTPQPTPRARR
ncbi:unnamed protein product [Plutella xylostella]|uniref:(diamondback moth) hypothetical protein n=1 Tax=Plutella xylostella TaxID=51655 RepID=A0A8S4GAH8_PLUXY|nr:unnamed protein product [Plutella xylostella]